MPEYLAPGTYVEELPNPVVPIQGVSTSTAGFVGRTERGPDGAVLVTSWPEYVRWFGGIVGTSVSYLPYAVQGFFVNGGQRLFVSRVTGANAAASTLTLPGGGDGQGLLVTAVGAGGWGDAVSVSVTPSLKGTPGRFRLRVRYTPPDGDPYIEEDHDDLGIDPAQPRYALGAVNPASHLVRLDWQGERSMPALEDAYTALAGGSDGDALNLDAWTGGSDPQPDRLRGLAALAAVDEISIVAAPDAVNNALGDQVLGLADALIEQCELLRDRFAVLDIGRGAGTLDQITPFLGRRSDFAAIYYPFLRVLDPRGRTPELVPPSGFVAGIYAFNDVTRGVHKAPANYEVRGILSRNVTANETPVEFPVSKRVQDVLNPLGVNVIRDFRAGGQGVRVWGARTISADPGWIYVNVRRLFLFVEESIDQALQWVVFEPNDEPTWARVRQSISTFLERVWRDGGLMGTSPDQAYFVRCDRTTMSSDDILNGRLICQVGLAPVRPAEFVVLRFFQLTIEATS